MERAYSLCASCGRSYPPERQFCESCYTRKVPEGRQHPARLWHVRRTQRGRVFIPPEGIAPRVRAP